MKWSEVKALAEKVIKDNGLDDPEIFLVDMESYLGEPECTNAELYEKENSILLT